MVRIPGFHPGGPGSIPGMTFFLTVQYMIYAVSIFLFPFLLLNSLFVEVRGKWLLFLGTQFCRMVARPINIEIVMSADVWGTDHTRWLPGETGHTEVCTLTIGDCCDVW